MTPELTIRLFSNDQYCLDKVFYSNFYRLKPREDKEQNVVVDIGAHCGYFAFAAMSMGAKRIYCFEPFIDNFRILSKNTEQSEAGVIIPHQLGVYPISSNLKFFYPTYGEGKFFDFSNIEIDKTEGKYHTSPCISLDEILQEYVQEDVVDILKINMGYAEGEVLMSSHTLNRKVNAICGEIFSDKEGIQEFKSIMEKKGYTDSYFSTVSEEEGKFVFLLAKDKCDKYFNTVFSSE